MNGAATALRRDLISPFSGGASRRSGRPLVVWASRQQLAGPAVELPGGASRLHQLATRQCRGPAGATGAADPDVEAILRAALNAAAAAHAQRPLPEEGHDQHILRRQRCLHQITQRTVVQLLAVSLNPMGRADEQADAPTAKPWRNLARHSRDPGEGHVPLAWRGTSRASPHAPLRLD